YSIAILDAMRSINIPVVEVHLSNIYKREEYRKKSVTAEASLGVISGFGYYGYIMAIEFILNNLVREK
ncbi:type II 3-dehydroquinate dehydratase, partial [Clostridium botulinum]|nr:type II 3-dehydroquinate dehydratase [Clostridium botulinum]